MYFEYIGHPRIERMELVAPDIFHRDWHCLKNKK